MTGVNPRQLKFGLWAGLIALLAAGGGYWVGQYGHDKTVAPADALAQPVRKLLFYRNPMGLSDTSPIPKKDPMGMDYIAVYAGEEGEQSAQSNAAKRITISREKVQKLGVKTEAARLQVLDIHVRAVGRVEPDERRLTTIAPKFEGYVERLYVNTTGQPVSKGQPLFEVYSPELVSAQREYAIAAGGVRTLAEAGGEAQTGMQQLANASLTRLRNWDVSDEQLKALSKSTASKRTLTFRSPVSGIVTEKKAVPGMRFIPGDALYQVADLSTVWVIADVFEQDIGLIRSGTKARVKINAYPDKMFEGVITYVYPTLKTETRTVPVRIELPNPGLLLKPGMFAQVELSIAAKGKVIVVPVSAVIDSGTRQIVLVQSGEGRFEPREVTLGMHSADLVEITDGVKEGERVVVAANFLIDAESNLNAALAGFGHTDHGNKPVQAESTTLKVGVGHKASGMVTEVDAKAGIVSISHGPVASLKWPAMTMEFKTANEAILNTLKPGAGVDFEFVERGPGEWVITSVKPVADNAHAGH